MACYHPIPARRTSAGPWILNPEKGTADATVPCGKCLGCRSSTQISWTHRCTHEASLWQHNRFVTLTYDDNHLPHELIPYHLRAFLKRLREATPRYPQILTQTGAGIRYLACGEYGDKTLRPHYHLNIFNCAFKDEERYSKDLFQSETLTNLWGYGATKLAPFTPATAGYVAGYITQHGHRDYYNEDGELLEPPFKRQSTRPAIGLNWLKQNGHNVQHGYLIHEGGKQPIPRYYKKILARLAQAAQYNQPNTLQEAVIRQINKTLGDNVAKPKQETDRHHPERLRDQEIIHHQRTRRIRDV